MPRITTLEQAIIPESSNYAGMPANIGNFKKIKDMSDDKYICLLHDIYKTESMEPFSITGGYCRNHLLGVETATDIDVVYNKSQSAITKLKNHFKDIGENNVVSTFQLPDNTMHMLPYPYLKRIDGVKHTFIDPNRFDFTMNLGCISVVDKHLYAPPVTLFDIKNKIIRPCTVSLDGYYSCSVMALSMILRAIRFALKFDMSVHSSLLRAMKVQFALQNDFNTVDDISVYHVIKHVYEEPTEFKERYYSALRSLNFIDTDKYSTFDDYFKYIKEQAETEPRDAPVHVKGSQEEPY